MKILRRLHTYLGVFFAPLLIFFVATGWYQTVTVQRNKSTGQPGDWISNLSQVHVDQIYPSERGAQKGYSPRLFRWLVVAMSAALLGTIGLGIFLAFRTQPHSAPVWLSLVGGILLPVLFLWLAQKR